MIRPDATFADRGDARRHPARRRVARRSTCLAALLTVSLCVATPTPAAAAPVNWSLGASPNVGSAGNELTNVSCSSPTSCTAVGFAISAAGIRRTLVESWDGATWTVTPSLNVGTRNNSLSGVSCSAPTNCVAVGSFISGAGVDQPLAETLDGTTWSVASSSGVGSDGSELVAVSCSDPADCVAVGDSATAIGTVQTLVETWNGTAWSVTPSPSPAPSDSVLNGVSCTSVTSCVAVGYSVNGIGAQQTLVERWDGTSWSVIPTPATVASVVLTGVSCTSPTSCVAVGSLGIATKRTSIATWNGTTWSVVSSPNRGASNNVLSGVSCTSPLSCVAVGSNDTTAASQTLIETWNGTAWAITPSPNRGTIQNGLDGVACPTAISCVATGASASSIAKRTLVVSASAPPDVTPPTVTLSTPVDGAYYVVGQHVAAQYQCADEPTGSGLESCAGTVPDASPIDTTGAGGHSFEVTATDGVGNSATATASYTVAAAQHASAELPAGGGSITTDPGAGPTPAIPIATTIASSDEGPLSVDQNAVTLTPPAGFTVLGMQMNVVAPPASADAPLALVFDVDAAMLPGGTTPDEVSLLKDAALLPDCSGATALPDGLDACVTGRADAPSGGGNVRLTAIAVTAGQWNLALGTAAPPGAQISDASAPEGNAGTSLMQFTVTLSAPSALPVTVSYATTNGTAKAGSDYAAASGTLTFPPGQTLELVTVGVVGDTTAEPTETFDVTLSSPSGATIADALGVGTIVDDDSVAPGPPTSVVVTAGNTSATVRWSAPIHDGGESIGGYVVTPYIGGVAQPARAFPNLLREHAITGLTNGVAYTFKVAATNGKGTGAMSATSGVVVIGAPVAPVVSAVGSSTRAVVSWGSPANNGRTVTSYVVSVRQGATLQAAKTHTVTCTQPCTLAHGWTVTGLVNGKQYAFGVSALNSNGAGLPGSTTVLVSTIPERPGRAAAPTAAVLSIGVNLSWVAPSNGTATIASYVITPYRSGIAQKSVSVPGTLTTFFVVNLSGGSPYTFTITAINAVATGIPSARSNSATPP